MVMKLRQKKNVQTKPVRNKSTQVDKAVSDLIAQRNISSRGFEFVIVVLLAAILWTGVQTSLKIHHYRLGYSQLQEIKNEYMRLEIDYRRLLIEQQTFSSTERIASRAVVQLGMSFPSLKNKLILQPAPLRDKTTPTKTENLNQPIIDDEVSQ